MDELDNWQERLQSEVVTANLDKPMLLNDLAALPEHMQKEYITKLRRRYKARIPEIAGMLGCGTETVVGILERAGLASSDRGFKGRSKEQEDSWRLFLGTWGKAFDFQRGLEAPSGGEGRGTDSSTALCFAQNDGTGETEEGEETRLPQTQGGFAMTDSEAASQSGQARLVPTAVEARLRSFVLDLAGPLDAVLRRIEAFREIVGELPVRLTIRVDEED